MLAFSTLHIIIVLCSIIRVMFNLMVMVIAYYSLGSRRVCFVWQMIALFILLLIIQCVIGVSGSSLIREFIPIFQHAIATLNNWE